MNQLDVVFAVTVVVTLLSCYLIWRHFSKVDNFVGHYFTGGAQATAVMIVLAAIAYVLL